MTKQTEDKSVKRDYKSRMFTMIFRDKKELLQLYNAVAQRNYDNPELLTINTLENAIYMSMQNDLSFVIDSRLSLYEHQSTYNPNLPLRFLLYLSDLYQKMITGRNVYGTKIIQIPAPKFIVFYNGKEERPEKEVIKLSDSYVTQGEEVSLELLVDVLNINVGHNKKLLQACKTLGDYSEYVYRVREYAKEMSIGEAVDRAIDECIKDNILREFLERNRTEARAMSIYEYDQEEHIRLEREDAFADGHKLGREEGREEGRKLGEYKKLKELVAKKVEKGLTVPEIAEVLEESVGRIQDIVEELGKRMI
ncbi:MAG: hypothetical protein IJA54_08965 [Tyzzerella sp.]|nr:hypothetical protein [Tyzzerella sp.]